MPPNPLVSAGPTTTHASIPARRLELEAIPELDQRNMSFCETKVVTNLRRFKV
ncbi:hypothetical protein ACE6H2_006922 [Prunus campanulata]